MDVTQCCQATECLTATVTYCCYVVSITDTCYYTHTFVPDRLWRISLFHMHSSHSLYWCVEWTGAMPSPVMLCYKHCYEPTLPFFGFSSSHSAVSLFHAVCILAYLWQLNHRLFTVLQCTSTVSLVHRKALYWLINSWLFHDAVWISLF